MKSKLTFITLLAIVMASCSVQKRHYLKGFYIVRQKHAVSPNDTAIKKLVVHKIKAKEKPEPIQVKMLEPTATQPLELMASAKPLLIKKHKALVLPKTQKQVNSVAIKNQSITKEAKKRDPILVFLRVLIIVLGAACLLIGTVFILFGTNFITMFYGLLILLLGALCFLQVILSGRKKKD